MKNTGTCPKCGSKDLLEVPSSHFLDDEPKVRTTLFSSQALMTRYICTDCGYAEFWVDPKELKGSGAVDFHQKRAARDKEQDELDSYWRRKLQESKENKDK